jgi:L-asparaginase/Glu-tRNA(Gln) amidotransferase subunit D
MTLAHDGTRVTVTHTESEQTATTEELEVVARVVTEVEVTEQPRLDYIEGQALDLSDLEVELIFNDDSTETVPFGEFIANGLTVEPTNGTTMTLAHDGTRVTVTHTESEQTATTEELEVIARVVTEIEIVTQPR